MTGSLTPWSFVLLKKVGSSGSSQAAMAITQRLPPGAWGQIGEEALVFLFRRKKKNDEPLDMEARSPDTGLKYKDIALLGQMMKQGADLRLPRHALYYLYFGSQEAAEAGAVEARGVGYSCEVRDPLPAYPDQWALVCERQDAVLDIAGVRQADDLFQGIADRHHGEFDGWEAAL